jgi:hypothetical protein
MKKPDLSEVDRAYLAGIIDGEGSIMLIHVPKRMDRKWEHWNLVISLTNTDKRLIDWLEERLGGHVRYVKSVNPKWRDTYHWKVCSAKAVPILHEVLPYLKLKGEQAEIALEFLKTYKLVGRRGHPPETIETRRALAIEMRRLNNRGKEVFRWPNVLN